MEKYAIEKHESNNSIKITQLNERAEKVISILNNTIEKDKKLSDKEKSSWKHILKNVLKSKISISELNLKTSIGEPITETEIKEVGAELESEINFLKIFYKLSKQPEFNEFSKQIAKKGYTFNARETINQVMYKTISKIVSSNTLLESKKT
jgi:hypothetical protein